jgi:hypothetical protein
MSNRKFNIDIERDTEYLHSVIEECLKKNLSDKEIVEVLLNAYESSSLFAVISFTEQVIYD